jgi:hypothetical protein
LSDDQAERAIERALAVVAKWEVCAPRALDCPVRLAARAGGRARHDRRERDGCRRQRGAAYVHETARSGIAEATADGVDVRGYLSWTRCGNIEWVSGLELTFGPVAVDPPTFARTVKPPTRWLGEVTRRRNALP